MIKILLDSSNKDLYVALIKDDTLLDEITYTAWQRQSEYMVVELENILKRNKVDKKDIDGVIVGIGPGSYTGVRISLTIAKTIALALNVKLYPVSSLLLLCDFDKYSLGIINARSKRSYAACYYKGEAIFKDKVISNEELLNFINEHQDYELYGEATHLGLEAKNPQIGDNITKLMAKLKPCEDILTLSPMYLKD